MGVGVVVIGLCAMSWGFWLVLCVLVGGVEFGKWCKSYEVWKGVDIIM